MAGSLSSTEAENSDFSNRAVPAEARIAKLPLTMAWWGVCSAVFYIVVGAAMALDFGTRNAIIGIVLSVIVYGIINSILSRFAIRTGLSVALFSRVLFGNAGAGLATLIFCATAIYYAVFEGSVIAVGVHTVFSSIPYDLAALIVVVCTVPLVFGSLQKWLDKFNGVLLPFYILGLIVAVGLAIGEYGYSDKWLSLAPAHGAPAYGWWSCFVYYMGVWVLMMFTFDYARFGREQDAGYHAWFNFGTPFYAMAFLVSGLFGMFMIGTVPDLGALSEVSVLLALLKLMGIWGLLFVWITQTRINTANYYLAAVNLEAIIQLFGKLPFGRIGWAIVIGIVVYCLMLANVFSYLLEALAYQGIFVVAWVAVAMAHILVSSHDTTIIDVEGHRSSFNLLGIIAWFGASALGIILHVYGGEYAAFSAPATAIFAFVIYAVGLSKVQRPTFG